MSKKTDEDIKKALECCKGGFCCGCPRLSNNMVTVDCMRELTNDTLDLINRTKGEAIHYRRKAQNQKQELSRLNAEIEKLTINMNAFGLGMKREKERADTIRAEAIKECLEWVFSLFPEDKNFTTISRFTVNQKLKEMVGENK